MSSSNNDKKKRAEEPNTQKKVYKEDSALLSNNITPDSVATMNGGTPKTTEMDKMTSEILGNEGTNKINTTGYNGAFIDEEQDPMEGMHIVYVRTDGSGTCVDGREHEWRESGLIGGFCCGASICFRNLGRICYTSHKCVKCGIKIQRSSLVA
ncbi:hypothetical protein AX774_g71 [Zancudomyces culisetae]|uniref:Uncharacterized protein n=1 Tax=Zancudomyces culisetae TaxID=1213189 RepID=A0A1R1PZH2_ZANCU|nr:hypothetical protein AX774_g71 [Zancudomyces culisetae]|eukprot:OMH86350.1 hypothetical protein AX774_g71 [Zancudomyces culisetae]